MAPEVMIVDNNPNVTNWSLENGYEGGINDIKYPIRMFNARQSGALVVYLRLYEQDLEYLCRGPIQGFKVILTTPGESLKMSRHSFRVHLSEQADILIRPKLITTADELRSYKPEQRQCFFGSERKLKFFRFYAQHNCELECLANFTHRECGCVKFFMPSMFFML